MKWLSIELIKKHKLRSALIAIIAVCVVVLFCLYVNNGSSYPQPAKKRPPVQKQSKGISKNKTRQMSQAALTSLPGRYVDIQSAKLSKLQKFDQFIKYKVLSDKKLSESEKEAYIGYLYSLDSLIQKKSDEDQFEDQLSNLNNKSQLTALEKQISKNEEEEAQSKLAIAKSAFEQQKYSSEAKEDNADHKNQVKQKKLNPLDVLSVRVIYEKGGKKHALLAIGNHTHEVSIGSRLFNGKYSVTQVKDDSITVKNLKTKKEDTFLIR